MKGHQKITVSLPVSVVSDLGLVCTRLSVSRSALLTQLLQVPIHDLAAMTVVLESPIDTAEKLRRFRGESVGLVSSRLAEFQASADALGAAFDAVEGGQS